MRTVPIDDVHELPTEKTPMSKKASNTVAQMPAAGSRFDAYSVREYEANGEKKSDRTRIGVAFAHADGKGLNVS